MKIEVTEEFKKLHIDKQTYSVRAVILYILFNQENNEINLHLKQTALNLGMTPETFWLALKKLKELKFIYKVAKSTYKINDKYVK